LQWRLLGNLHNRDRLRLKTISAILWLHPAKLEKFIPEILRFPEPRPEHAIKFQMPATVLSAA